MPTAPLVALAPDALAALLPIAERASLFVESDLAPRTRAAYALQWRLFSEWCAQHGLDALPAQPATLPLYLTARASGASPWKVSTLGQALAAIRHAHLSAGYEVPRSSALERTWKGIRRELGVAPAQKLPLLEAQLRAMIAALPKTHGGARDRALLLVGFAGAFRRSELVALELADITFSSEGMKVRVRRSKTDQEGRGRDVPISYGRAAATCPVRATQAWLKRAGISEGPVFRSVHRSGRVGGQLRGGDVAAIIKRRAEAAGLDARAFSGHSLRAGLVTSAAKAGRSAHSIMKKTGHGSVAMVHRYIRDAALFDDDAAAGLL